MSPDELDEFIGCSLIFHWATIWQGHLDAKYLPVEMPEVPSQLGGVLNDALLFRYGNMMGMRSIRLVAVLRARVKAVPGLMCVVKRNPDLQRMEVLNLRRRKGSP
jgi:hypothetical protein